MGPPLPASRPFIIALSRAARHWSKSVEAARRSQDCEERRVRASAERSSPPQGFGEGFLYVGLDILPTYVSSGAIRRCINQASEAYLRPSH